jgi:hypothetical protein
MLFVSLEPHPDCPASSENNSPPPSSFPSPPPNVASFDTSTPVTNDSTASSSFPFTFGYSLAQSDGLGDPVIMTHEPTHADEPYAYEALTSMQVPRVTSISSTHDPIKSCALTLPITVLTPPLIEG